MHIVLLRIRFLDQRARQILSRIMTHSEDRNGASVRSILPVNYLTTTLEIDNDKKEILFHQAVAAG